MRENSGSYLQESEAKTLIFGNLVATYTQCFPIRMHPFQALEDTHHRTVSTRIRCDQTAPQDEGQNQTEGDQCCAQID